MVRNKELRQLALACAVIAALSAVGGFALHPAAGFLSLVSSAALGGVFLGFTRARYRRIAQLAEEVDRVLHNADTLSIQDAEEGELSILHSELTKMTLRLREQNAALRREKRHLADALADIAHQLRTPLTAAIFALEVVHVGIIQYAALVPAFLSSLTGFLLAGYLGVPPTAYTVSGLPVLSPLALVQVVVMGGLCAALSVLFCKVMHGTGRLYAKYLPDARVRAVAGGFIMIGLSLLDGGLSDQVYNGAGGNLVQAAVTGNGAGVEPWGFLVKIVFTALTLGAGFRGGEIVPTFACGATFGCVAGPLIGLSPSFGGALGTVAAFCGVTNCPLSSILLAYELFGGGGLPLFALAIAVSYRLSGYTGLYSEQQIVYSKRTPHQIDKKAE